MKVGLLARHLAFILAASLAALASDAKSPTTFTQLGTLDPSDATADYQFGNPSAISGDTVVVGVAGAVYVFVKPSTGWQDATQIATLMPSVSVGNFGNSVAISGNMIVVVANGCCNEGQSYPGEADVFVKPATGWATRSTPNAALKGSDETSNDYYGTAVSISGDTMVVGSYYHHNSVGAAYVFVKPTAGWKRMTQTAELTAPDGEVNDHFGNAVSISGNTIAVGASNWDHNQTGQSGAIYVYTKPATGWVTTSRSSAELFPPANSPAALLGATVGVGNGVVIGGAPYATINNQLGEGAVFVFGP